LALGALAVLALPVLVVGGGLAALAAAFVAVKLLICLPLTVLGALALLPFRCCWSAVRWRP